MKLKKSVLPIIVAAVMVTGLVACGGSESSSSAVAGGSSAGTESVTATSGKASSGGKWKVSVVMSDMTDESLVKQADTVKDNADKYNLDVSVFDAQGDPQRQIQLITNTVSQGFDALVCNPSDSKAVGPAIKEAHDHGVITVFMSADIDESYGDYRDCFVGPIDTDAGQKACKALEEALPDGGKIIEIGGQASHIGAIQRHEGFTEALKDSNLELLEYQACQEWNPSQAMAIAEDMITKYGDDINGIFCHWDNGATGVIEALQNAGMDPKEIPIVGVDGCKAGYDQVENGTQYATIGCSYDEMGQKVAEFIDDKMSGANKVELEDGWWYKMEWDVVKADNIDDFEYPTW